MADPLVADMVRQLRIARAQMMNSPDELIRSNARLTVARLQRTLGDVAARAEGYPPARFKGQYDLSTHQPDSAPG